MASAHQALNSSDPEALFNTMQQLAVGSSVEEEILSSVRESTMNGSSFNKIVRDAKPPDHNSDDDSEEEEEIKKTFAMKLDTLNQKIKLFRKEFYSSKREEDKRKLANKIKIKHLKWAKEK